MVLVTNSEGFVESESAVLTVFADEIPPHLVSAIVSLSRDQIIIQFIRGDANNDANVNLPDTQFILNFLFLGGPSPKPPFPSCGNGELATDVPYGLHFTTDPAVCP